MLKRKARNRRLESRHVLDVKMRSDRVRTQLGRHVAVALGAAFALAFSLYVAVRCGGWLLDEVVYRNRAFAIRSIEVQTDGGLTAEQIRKWAGVRAGENLFALDLGRVQRNLEFVPVIKLASIERVPPGTLRIRVIRRDAIAKAYVRPPASTGTGVEPIVYHLDDAGFVMFLDAPLRRQLLPDDQDLPVLTGVPLVELRPGRTVESTQVAAALQLIEAFNRSPMANRVRLHSVDVSADEVLEVTTGQGSRVTFGPGGLDRQLFRWLSVHELGLRVGRIIRSLDLAVKQYSPLIWMDTEAFSAGPGTAQKAPAAVNPGNDNV